MAALFIYFSMAEREATLTYQKKKNPDLPTHSLNTSRQLQTIL